MRTFMWLANGQEIFLPDMEGVDNLTIEDCLAMLSKVARFNGQVRVRWSVLHHSLLTSYIAFRSNAGRDVEIACLLHDIEESVLSDIPSPVKHILADETGVYNSMRDNFIYMLAKTNPELENFNKVTAEVDEFDKIATNIEGICVTKPQVSERWKAYALEIFGDQKEYYTGLFYVVKKITDRTESEGYYPDVVGLAMAVIKDGWETVINYGVE